MKMVARFIPILTMGLLVAALSAGPVLADPGHKGGHGNAGGNGGGKGNGGNDTTGTGTLSVSPEHPDAYSMMTIEGTGFAANSEVKIKIQENWCCVWGSAMTDGTGSFSLTTRTRDPGYYEVWAYEPTKKGDILAHLGFPVGEQR